MCRVGVGEKFLRWVGGVRKRSLGCWDLELERTWDEVYRGNWVKADGMGESVVIYKRGSIVFMASSPGFVGVVWCDWRTPCLSEALICDVKS